MTLLIQDHMWLLNDLLIAFKVGGKKKTLKIKTFKWTFFSILGETDKRTEMNGLIKPVKVCKSVCLMCFHRETCHQLSMKQMQRKAFASEQEKMNTMKTYVCLLTLRSQWLELQQGEFVFENM